MVVTVKVRVRGWEIMTSMRSGHILQVCVYVCMWSSLKMSFWGHFMEGFFNSKCN